MNITAHDAKTSRTKLGLSQAAVAKATGIPRNIMSAFEQGKIVMLDEMQIALVEFLDSQGLTLEVPDDPIDSDPGTSGEGFSDETSLEDVSDSRIRGGFCIPSGLDLCDVDAILEQVYDTELEIEHWLPSEVRDDGIFFKSISSDSREKHDQLVLLYARWACLVQQMLGRHDAVIPCDVSEIDDWPEDQHQLMCQTLAKEFGVVGEAA